MVNRWAKIEIVTDFIFLGSKIIVDGDCSHEIKRCFLLGRKTMTNLVCGAVTTEPTLESGEEKLLSPQALEPMLSNKRSHRSDKLSHFN